MRERLISKSEIIDISNRDESHFYDNKAFEIKGDKIVGSYKSAVTKNANRSNLEFAWQSRFYDHIIRDQQYFARISEYIQKNPQNWKEDSLFPEV
ncbi:hypothetical protein [Salinimicrobium xinjiangense]|uniref:hypothetical protein n=1 Tax=Salinimicrobium xinjiangense TaxID=438596 RepID=UPI00041F931C|nr:hypothetical protein [Salinimicrobium xinjiangense]